MWLLILITTKNCHGELGSIFKYYYDYDYGDGDDA